MALNSYLPLLGDMKKIRMCMNVYEAMRTIGKMIDHIFGNARLHVQHKAHSHNNVLVALHLLQLQPSKDLIISFPTQMLQYLVESYTN